ncbi:Mrp/NBP35 family ATP-binding protein [Bdellovibrio sp. HCB274]|uniref:Mrp/NBP35 family ATP-binding protein n=1 Tax=Bdellovibrio sp. HCB274 TaxID=3394361 RepID=UPI0039B66816
MAAPNPFEKQTSIPGVKHIIAVSSGKGGVGKSTVATNLAMALGRKAKVGLLDADIYGPSIPRMLGSLSQKPQINPDTNQLEPIQRYGIKLMSIGFLIEENSAVVWRGPMLFKAMDQFLRDVNWGELDYLVVDLPPGTGDIQLTLAQKVPVAGAVLVSTPQNVALIDVKKAVDMFQRVNVPLLGMIENMAYMINPVNGEKMQLFPKGEMDSYAAQKGIAKLGEIPFNPSVGLACEAGIPIVEANSNGAEAQAFMAVADKLREILP